MISKIRQRVTYADIAMTIALLFAMTGGAYAAKKYVISNTKQISPKVFRQLKGARGPAGAQGPAGANGKDGVQGLQGAEGKDGVNGESVKSKVVTTSEPTKCGGLDGAEFTIGTSAPVFACNGKEGAQGQQGLPGESVTIKTLAKGTACAEGGAEFSNGSGKATACNGANGGTGTVTEVNTGKGLTGGPITSTGTISVNSTEVQSRVTGTCPSGEAVQSIGPNGEVTCKTAGAGLPVTLGSGETETGVWMVRGTDNKKGELRGAPISFSIPLKNGIAGNHAEFIGVGGTPKTGLCKGSLTNPGAEPGFLCVFAGKSVAFKGGLSSPGLFVTPNGAFGTETTGTELFFETLEPTTVGEEVSAEGTWAVTGS